MPLPLREAAGIEGLIVLGVIYFILNVLQKAGQKAAKSRAPEPPRPAGGPGATQQEGLSLDSILRQIERVKSEHRPEGQAPRPAPVPPRRPIPTGRPTARPSQGPRRLPAATSDRGPLGRHGSGSLAGDEEAEDRTNFDEQVVSEVEVASRESIEAVHRRRNRPEVDQDDAAEAIVQRRIREAEARDRPASLADHRQFDVKVRAKPEEAAEAPRLTASSLRQAFIWREILGPPKALE